MLHRLRPTIRHLSRSTTTFIQTSKISPLPLLSHSIKPTMSIGQKGPGHPMAIGTFPSFSTVNFYAGNELSRVSWLRNNSDFLNDVLTRDSTRFIVMQNLNPMVYASSQSDSEHGNLAMLKWKDVRETINEACGQSGKESINIFGPASHGLSIDQNEDTKTFDRATQGMSPTSIALVFLGMDESHLEQGSLPGKTVKSSSSTAPAGTPIFALSLSYRPPGTPEDQLVPVERLADKLTKDGTFDFVDTRSLAQAGKWPLHNAAMVAQARSLLDWNERQQFCPACGRRQYSLWAGWKRACASSLINSTQDPLKKSFIEPLLIDGKSLEQDGKGDCATTHSLSNFCYPRTDPTVIMAIVSPDGEKILLGRQKKWPKGFYSCLAGFLEPAESLEEAVRREIFEESGVSVGKVIYHSSQPWPFPANLMMGAIGQAIEGKDEIRLDLDNELEDARFFTREEVLNVLASSTMSTLSRHEVSKMDETVNKKALEQQQQRKEQAGQGKKWNEKDEGSVANVLSDSENRTARPKFRIPGQTAIAHVLISAWAKGEAHFPDNTPNDSKVYRSEVESTRGRM